MFRAFACLVMVRSCAGSIIALRSANLLCRALLPKNRSPASALRSWHAATSRRWLAARLPCRGTEHIGCPFLELRLPRCDLIGVDVELLRKLSQGSIALQGRKRYLRLEGRRVVPARSSVHGLS